jgi:hypothetical protein
MMALDTIAGQINTNNCPANDVQQQQQEYNRLTKDAIVSITMIDFT